MDWGNQGSACVLIVEVSSKWRLLTRRAKFKPPIYHCNVDEKNGGISAAEILCTISDLLVSPASAPGQNQSAVDLFKNDRVKYDLLARENAIDAMDDQLKLIPDILDLFLPPHNMSTCSAGSLPCSCFAGTKSN